MRSLFRHYRQDYTKHTIEHRLKMITLTLEGIQKVLWKDFHETLDYRGERKAERAEREHREKLKRIRRQGLTDKAEGEDE